MTEKLFEYAVRNKLRFLSVRGELTVEQLWDVPLRSGFNDAFNLGDIAKSANKAFINATEENFVETEKNPAHVKLEMALEVVKHVIHVKKEEEDFAKKRAENKREREYLLAVLADKQADKLSALSEKELQRRIAALE